MTQIIRAHRVASLSMACPYCSKPLGSAPVKNGDKVPFLTVCRYCRRELSHMVVSYNLDSQPSPAQHAKSDGEVQGLRVRFFKSISKFCRTVADEIDWQLGQA